MKRNPILPRPLVLFACSAVVCATAFGQGSLTPPGAPAPTMKTLEQVEARIDLATVAGNTQCHHFISQSGSYYLSANLGVTKTDGVRIGAPNVTLDLNGFNVSRVSGSGGYGIKISDDAATVRNGSVAGFSYGVAAYTVGPKGAHLENLVASECTDYGIFARLAARLVDCRAHDNPGGGVYGGTGSVLSGCIANRNSGVRISAGYGTVVEECCAYENLGQYGIRAAGGAALIGCIAYNNGASVSNSCGIEAGADSVVVNCTARGNTNSLPSHASSEGVGIRAWSGSVIRDCSSNLNGGDGIAVSAGCLVSHNTCRANGYGDGDGAGIHATGRDNRIEGNNVTDSDRGIDVDGSGNFIVRNTCSGNDTNWTVVAGNVCKVVSATPGTAVSGDEGGTYPGDNHPLVNFTY